MQGQTAFSSSEYDKKIKMTIPYYTDICRQVSEVIHVYKGKQLVWLDIGCGTGTLPEYVCGRCPIAELVLCDSSPDMLACAEKNSDM